MLLERIVAFCMPTAKVVYFDKTKLIIRVHTFFAASVIGTDAWCLCRTYNHWKSYIIERKNNFYIVYNIEDPQNQLVGICVSKTKERDQIAYMYNQGNDSVKEQYVDYNANLINSLVKYNNSNFIMRYIYRTMNSFFADPCGFKTVS